MAKEIYEAPCVEFIEFELTDHIAASSINPLGAGLLEQIFGPPGGGTND